jgi:hypothetical protein
MIESKIFPQENHDAFRMILLLVADRQFDIIVTLTSPHNGQQLLAPRSTGLGRASTHDLRDLEDLVAKAGRLVNFLACIERSVKDMLSIEHF